MLVWSCTLFELSFISSVLAQHGKVQNQVKLSINGGDKEDKWAVQCFPFWHRQGWHSMMTLCPLPLLEDHIN